MGRAATEMAEVLGPEIERVKTVVMPTVEGPAAAKMAADVEAGERALAAGDLAGMIQAYGALKAHGG